ncbi:MAG TPA: ice-binding family protein [Candidatus Limnocylindrales bacterium]
MLRRGLPISLTLAVLVGFAFAGNVAASSAIGLGTAGAFAVLGASTVTNTGPSVINGDLGVSPGSAVTGFPPGIVNGTIHAADGVAAQAQSDLTTAYNNAAGQACNTNLTGQDLGGLTLTAGVYCFSSSAGLTGALTLNAKGVSGARFIFQVGSALTTASSSTVNYINGAQPCNVFWQIGSSATLGTATSFVGNIMALASITMTTGATLKGRALARNGAVTLDTNVITEATCDTNGGSGGSGGSSGSSGGSIGGPCNDPAFYGVFDNTASNVVVRFRMKWTTTTGLKVAAVYVPAGSIYRTWEHWAKPGTKVMVSYKDPNSGKWINVASVTSVHGMFPPCVYKHGFDTP